MNAKRIFIYGVTGSGKSTLAQQVAERTGLPYVAVDDLTWEPGWKIVPFDHQNVIFAEICDRQEWVMDSAYGHWLEIPLARVELIVAMDYPRWVSFGRLFKRTFKRLIDQQSVCNGNYESLKVIFSRESILLWHFRSFRRKRERIKAWEAEGRAMITFRHPREAEQWLNSLHKSS